jgi:hypothetical protein
MMHRVVFALAVSLACQVAAQSPPAGPLEGGSVAQKQALQERVRGMARDLVGGVIDTQLQQLRENGLEGLSIYGELTEMRKHVDQLVARQMPGVLEVLGRLAEAPADDRPPLLLAARQKSRQVLVGLLVERQAVLRRLRIAEIAAQVRRVIAMQTAVLDVTQKLPGEVVERRESGTLRAIEDQADVAAVYRGLKEMLRDASNWTGAVGTEATEGLRQLESARVEAELASAESRLRAVQLAEAPANQQAVIRGLEPLLVRMERAQGLDEPDVTAEETLRDLIKEQEQLRRETADTNLSQPEADKLVNRQAELAKRLQPFAEAQNPPPEMKQALQQAQAAAKEAAAKLFEQKREEALAEQDKAIEALKRADTQSNELPAAKKAEQMEASKLEQTRDELKQILEQQQKASADAAEKPQEAQRQEQQVATRLAEMPQKHAMPEEVKKRVDEAQKAAEQAAQQMHRPQPERQQAVRAAEQAIERAVAQAEAAAQQAKLRELAERAKPPEQANASPQAQAEQKKAAEELKQLLAEMRKNLEQARQAVEQEIGDRMDSAAKRAERLAEAEEKVAQAVAEQQQAAGRPQAAEAARMARQVEKAAQAQAEAARSADKQADLTRALAKMAAETKSVPMAEALREAEKAARQAAEEMAQGQPAEAAQAAAREALEKAQHQARAQVAEARKTPSGKPDMQAQQRVTQAAVEAQRMAQTDAPQAAETLNKAQAESTAAAQRASEGKAEPAAQSQQATAEMLDRAAQQLAEAARQLAAQTPPEFAGQSQRAQQLAQKAMPADPEAMQALQRAENQAREAAEQRQPTPTQASAADRRVGQALEEAAASLAQRERQLGQAAQPRSKSSMLARVKAKTDRSTQQQPPAEQSETGRRMEDDALSPTSTDDVARRGAPAVARDPWLAKLPPEVRSAIRANSQRTPPRGYEERMQKYFRNIE